MKPFFVKDAVKAVNGRFFGDPAALDARVDSVTSDSRLAGPGSLFVAFKGARADGHSFMADCIRKGAAACISEREPAGAEETPCIAVDSSLRAIGALAAWHRGRFDIPVIGITGSVGKTTTKEMIASVLEQRYDTHKTDKNFNNELGVPWTLLRLDDANQVSVVEMGISSFGEMRRLTAMVRPSVAVFTVIGDSHLEFLGDRAGVLRAKSEIFEGMGPDGLAVLNGDDELLRGCRPNLRVATYGLRPDNDVRAEDVRVDVPETGYGDSRVRFTVRHPGGAFEAAVPGYVAGPLVYATLAAAAVGLELGLTESEIAAGIAAYRAVGDRARVLQFGGVTVISDCYNANPNSMKAALDALSGMEGRRVCILGDMLELGAGADALHRGVGEYAAAKGIDLTVGCGPLAKQIAEGAKAAGGEALYFENKAALLEQLDELIRSGDRVLVKASHSMAFEEIVERLKNRA